MTEKALEHRLAWLAGIIDGEGHVGLSVRVNQGNGGYACVDITVEIANTEPAMLVEVMAIADLVGAKYSQGQIKPQTATRKLARRVTFCSRQSCVTILAAVMPYLVSKRPHAELMLRAIHHRSRYGRPSKVKTSPYLPIGSDNELRSMATAMTALNRRGASAGG